MRIIETSKITKIIEKLFIEANYNLPDDVRKKLQEAYKTENNERAKIMLDIIIKNYQKADEGDFPICQDTGMAIIFIEVGSEVHFNGEFINDAIEKGVKNAYLKGFLRKSVVEDPLMRKNTGNNLPAIIHMRYVRGDKVKITVVPKGFGSENQSALKMLTPAEGRRGIVDFVVNGVINSGGKGCPPAIIGIGIGGDFEYSAYLSKRALLLPIDKKSDNAYYDEIAEEITQKINNSDVGVMGTGGKSTVLKVNILTYPTHIAGLPVAYNYCCHACRHKSIVI